MSLGKLLKKLLPVAKTAGAIVVTQGTGATAAATLLRQAILIGGGILTAKGLATDDQVQAGVAAVGTLATVLYGLAHNVKEKKERAAVADVTSNAHFVLDGQQSSLVNNPHLGG